MCILSQDPSNDIEKICEIAWNKRLIQKAVFWMTRWPSEWNGVCISIRKSIASVELIFGYIRISKRFTANNSNSHILKGTDEKNLHLWEEKWMIKNK